MKLKNESIVKMRDEVERRIESVPNGTRIKLPKDLLEQLLFDECTYNKEENKILKLPVWSGKFLQKIDLSEIDFEDVSWALYAAPDLSLFESLGACKSKKLAGIDDAFVTTMRNRLEAIEDEYRDKDYYVMYGGTNAKIDLTKSFEAKEFNIIAITRCDFSGIDLSSNSSDLSYLDEFSVWFSNLRDTDFTITSIPERFWASRSDFSNIDLSSLVLDALRVIVFGGGVFNECNLTNTGIKLVYTDEEYAKYCDAYCRRFDCEQVDTIETLEYNIENYWKGCYVNGKLNSFSNSSFMSDDDSDYSRFEVGEFERMFSSIDEQVSRDAIVLKK